MHGTRGYIALSEKIAVQAGGTYQLPLKLQKGLRGPRGLDCTHVTKLHLVFDTVTTGNFGSDSILDSAFFAQLVNAIELYASQDSPLGNRKGGQIVKSMSGYLALTALSQVTGAPMFNFGAESRYVMPNVLGSDPIPGNVNAATSTPRVKRLHGRFNQQGPWGSVANGDPFSGRVAITLPIGERVGEPGSMNPIPLGWLNGSGSAAGCTKSEGLINLTLASTAQALALTFANVQVFAEVVFLPAWHFPLQPSITTYQTTDTVISLDPGISGFRALCEDLTAGGAQQLTNVAGVSQYKLTVDGYELYSSQYPEARAAWVAGNTLNGRDQSDWAEADPDASADLYPGTLGAARYSNAWVPIITHAGPSENAPDFGVGGVRRVCFELVNASAAVNRRVLQALFLPHDDAYLARCQEYAGTTAIAPKVPLGALSPTAVSRGLAAAVPAVSAKVSQG